MNLKQESLDQQQFNAPDLNMSENSSSGSDSTISNNAEKKLDVKAKQTRHSIVEFNKKIDSINQLLDKSGKASRNIAGMTSNLT